MADLIESLSVADLVALSKRYEETSDDDWWVDEVSRCLPDYGLGKGDEISFAEFIFYFTVIVPDQVRQVRAAADKYLEGKLPTLAEMFG